MKRRTEIQVGLTVILALVTLVWSVTWLKDLSLARKVRIWHVRFPQTGGLGPSDEVQVNGIRKGAVDGIALQGDKVIVNLGLSSDIVLTDQCRVAIRNVGLMGEKVIAVDLTMGGTPYTERDTIAGIFEQGMGEVMSSAGTSMASVDRLIVSLNRAADRLEASGDLDKSLANFRETSEELNAMVKQNRKVFERTLGNAEAVTNTAKALTADREEQYKRTLDSVERSARNLELLSHRLDSLSATTQSVMGKVDRGNGTLGALVNDKQLYTDVSESVKALKAVLEDLKKNPKKYINLSIF